MNVQEIYVNLEELSVAVVGVVELKDCPGALQMPPG